LKTKWCGEYVDLREMKLVMNGAYYIDRNFIVYTTRLVLLGESNQGRYDGLATLRKVRYAYRILAERTFSKATLIRRTRWEGNI